MQQRVHSKHLKAFRDGEESELTREANGEEENVSNKEHEMHEITSFVEYCKSCKMLLHDFHEKSITQMLSRNHFQIDLWMQFSTIH